MWVIPDEPMLIYEKATIKGGKKIIAITFVRKSTWTRVYFISSGLGVVNYKLIHEADTTSKHGVGILKVKLEESVTEEHAVKRLRELARQFIRKWNPIVVKRKGFAEDQSCFDNLRLSVIDCTPIGLLA